METFEKQFANSGGGENPCDVLAASFNPVTVTYTPHSGEASSFTARWKPDGTAGRYRGLDTMVERFQPDGEQQLTTGTLLINPSDLSSVDLRDKLAFGGTTYAVVSVGRMTPVLELCVEARVQHRLGGSGQRRPAR